LDLYINANKGEENCTFVNQGIAVSSASLFHR